MALLYSESDAAAVCGPTVACSPNGLGANTVTGRLCGTGAPGTQEVTVTMAASEASKIYAYLELAPTVGAGATRNWFRTFLIFGFRVTSPNVNVDWTRTDVCHVNAACTSVETLGSDTNAVSCGPAEKDFILKTMTLSVAAVPVAAGDKVLILLSFTNNAASVQSFGWRPDQPVTLTDWDIDRGIEVILGRKRPKKKRPPEALLLLLGDAEPWED